MNPIAFHRGYIAKEADIFDNIDRSKTPFRMATESEAYKDEWLRGFPNRRFDHNQHEEWEDAVEQEMNPRAHADLASGAGRTGLNAAGWGVIGSLLGALNKDDTESRLEATGRGALRGAGFGAGASLGSILGAKISGTDRSLMRVLGAILGGTTGYAAGAEVSLSPREEAEREAEEDRKAGMKAALPPKPTREELKARVLEELQGKAMPKEAAAGFLLGNLGTKGAFSIGDLFRDNPKRVIDTLSTLAGAVGGGYLGNKLTGDTAGTVGGAVLGGGAGFGISNALTTAGLDELTEASMKGAKHNQTLHDIGQAERDLEAESGKERQWETRQRQLYDSYQKTKHDPQVREEYKAARGKQRQDLQWIRDRQEALTSKLRRLSTQKMRTGDAAQEALHNYQGYRPYFDYQPSIESIKKMLSTGQPYE